MPLGGGHYQCRIALVVDVFVSLRRSQMFQPAAGAVRSGSTVEGTIALVVGDADACAVPQEEGCDSSCRGPGCLVQKGATLLVGYVGVSPILEEELCDV